MCHRHVQSEQAKANNKEGLEGAKDLVLGHTCGNHFHLKEDENGHEGDENEVIELKRRKGQYQKCAGEENHPIGFIPCQPIQ